jgi:ubiquitin-protein ligase
MQICSENGFPAYAAADGILDWCVLIRGPLPGTSHQCVHWPLAITFRPDYPYAAPVFRFLALPPLKNVSEIGRVCSRAIDAYHPRTRIAGLLIHIQGLFDTPDDSVPYSMDSAAESAPWKVADYDSLIAAGTVDPWLPLPDLEYLHFVVGDIATGGTPLPKRKRPTDLALHAYSQLTGRRIDGCPVEVHGIVIAPDEEKFFALS